MSDIWSKTKRFEVMSRIRGKGNQETNVRMARMMRMTGIKGWIRHLSISRRQELSFLKQKVGVFVDGCFWHGCFKCFQLPKQNRAFWKAKIEGNRKTDRLVDGRLRRLGWKVIRIRECQLGKADNVLVKVKKALGS